MDQHTVQGMIAPAITAAFEADRRAAQLQSQLDLMGGQLRSVQGELGQEKSRVMQLQSQLEQATANQRSLRDQFDSTTKVLQAKVDDARKHHEKCLQEAEQGFKDQERRLRRNFEDSQRALQQSYEEDVVRLQEKILTEDQAQVLMNIRKRGNRKIAQEFLGRMIGFYAAEEFLKKAFRRVKGKKS